ncbi:MAG: HlyD family efflux transporter periplasmic adaptor subunit, partial [Planctomycetota bacterium]
VVAATQAVTSAENSLSVLVSRRSRLQTAESLAQTQLRAAEVNLERTEIRSPIEGVIVNENGELNSFIQRGSPIVTLEDTSKAEVAINLRMDQLVWVLGQRAMDQPGTTSPGQIPAADDAGNNAARGDSAEDQQQKYSLPETPAKIRYTLAGRETKPLQWEGKLVRYDGIGLDDQTRTTPVRVIVDHPTRKDATVAGDDDPAAARQTLGPEALVRGMFVQVTLEIRPDDDIRLALVPEPALRAGNNLWQFVDDADVLIPPEDEDAAFEDASTRQDTTDPSPSTDAPDADDETDDSGPPKFDPMQWRAGRALVRGPLRPIQRVAMADLRSIDEVRAAYGKFSERIFELDGSTNLWICELPDTMDERALVVVSPLASVGPESKVRITTETNQTETTLPDTNTADLDAAE